MGYDELIRKQAGRAPKNDPASCLERLEQLNRSIEELVKAGKIVHAYRENGRHVRKFAGKAGAKPD